MTPAEAVTQWAPRVDWPELPTHHLVPQALEHVREHQASQAHERHVPDDLVRRGSSCHRKAVTNYVREEHSSYPLLVERHPRLRPLARDKVNQLISRHYAALIPCTCHRCP